MAEAVYPDLSTEYPLSQEQLSSFRRDGHIHLPNVCSEEEVTFFRQIIRETALKLIEEQPPLEERDAYGKAFLQELNLRFANPGVLKFATARRFAKIAADLMGVDAVRIYHDQAIFKEPGGGGTPWHQDQYYWPLATTNTLGMWMPLVDVDLPMGPVRYASGSHRSGCVENMAISDESEEKFSSWIAEKAYKIWESDLKAGDALFHTGWTIHGAKPNTTNKLREATVVTFYEDGTRVDEFTNEHRPLDAKAFLDDRKPGELAVGPSNPIVYQRSV